MYDQRSRFLIAWQTSKYAYTETYELGMNGEPSSQNQGPSVWLRERPIQNELIRLEDVWLSMNSCSKIKIHTHTSGGTQDNAIGI